MIDIYIFRIYDPREDAVRDESTTDVSVAIAVLFFDMWQSGNQTKHSARETNTLQRDEVKAPQYLDHAALLTLGRRTTLEVVGAHGTCMDKRAGYHSFSSSAVNRNFSTSVRL